MKKFIITAILGLGFAAAAVTMPGYDVVIKITEKGAAACNRPGCRGE